MSTTLTGGFFLSRGGLWRVFAVVALVVGFVLAAGVVKAQGRPGVDFADLVDQVGPAVVNIRTFEKTNPKGSRNGGPDEDVQELLRRHFGDRFPQLPRIAPPSSPQAPPSSPQAQPETTRGVGSGFILTADGIVMTNAHVVEGADEILVTLTDRREFKAKLLGADKRSDVAVLKIEASQLPTVKVGDNNRLRVGDWVLAIGSPFGLDNTVTAGIVSAKQRDTGDFLPLIQTDVAINPGNSGGPLINLKGEVVGINSQIYSRSGGFMGISFSIPIDEAIRVGDQLRVSGRVVRGRIGVEIERVTKEHVELLGLPKAQGALVKGVQSGSVAASAGVMAGDVIIRFDGKPVENASDLPRLVGGTKPGTKATITVIRKGVSKDLAITVAEMAPDKVQTAAAQSNKEKSVAGHAMLNNLGVAVSDLSAAQRSQLQLKHIGVRVESVRGPAARAGLRAGDVLLNVAGAEVASVRELENVLSKHDKNKALSVQFLRDDWTRHVTITP